VRQVIGAVEQAGRCKVPVKESPRRPGDPPILVADASLAGRELGWVPEYALEKIVETAWRWYTHFRGTAY
jgi:UDP-glucose 4-epimerase